MKTDTRHYLGWGARARLFGRILGLTAFFAALVALFVLAAMGTDPTAEGIRGALSSSGNQQIATFVLLGGALVTLIVIVIELLAMVGGSGQRSGTGANAAIQVLLALVVFALLNYYSFDFFKRWDLTRDKEFTLPANVATELRKLDGKTTIVVLQQHKTFGQLSPKPDIYDYAAERKVVDKVKDLVEQFRLLGPQFRVVTLDVEAIGYENQLTKETESRPGLKEAIAAAPENSIFFYPDDRVETLPATEAVRRSAAGRKVHTQPVAKDSSSLLAYEGNIPRLSFNEFYQLDKTASKDANPGPDGKPRGNLVLRPQGVDSFARRVLAIQEKRPKVGLLVIHELLTSDPGGSAEETFTAAGLRKSFESHGFDVVDVVVKKWDEGEEPAPAAYALAETQFERLASELDGMEEERRSLGDDRKDLEEAQKLFKEKSLAELDKLFRAQIRRAVTDDDRQANLKAVADQLRQIGERLAELDVEQRDTEAQVAALLKNERAFEDRRVTDVKSKLNRLVSDCDMLIVPRMTVMNASAMRYIPHTLYRLSDDQVDVIRDFMKAGKPVLVCAGPNASRNGPAPGEPFDKLERLLADRGVQLGRETIITNAEAKGYAARRAGGQLGGSTTELPPISFATADDQGRDNPIAAAMRATAASAEQRLDIRLPDPRPVYVSPELAKNGSIRPEFLLSPAMAWNEENPMVIRNIGGGLARVVPPRFKATPFGDPKKGTNEEERRGPFPIGVAIESPPPVEWFDADFGGYKEVGSISTTIDGGILAACLTARSQVQPDRVTQKIERQTERKPSRLAVIGQGGLFTGKQLNPAQEQLLLHTCNWLLNRDDRLPRTDSEWSYPRVHRDDREGFLWKYGPFLGLPALFLYLGLIVWIVRRVR
jgi:hypothetical protein